MSTQPFMMRYHFQQYSPSPVSFYAKLEVIGRAAREETLKRNVIIPQDDSVGR